MFKALSARSIASRLFLSAAFWSILILALAGLGLSALNKQWSEANFDDQLGVYLKALVANVAVPAEEGKTAAPAAIAPQFELAFSGWYWQITRTDVKPAGDPRLEVAVRNPIAATGRGRARSRRHS